MGTKCCLCKEPVEFGKTPDHFQAKHPEYKFTIKKIGALKRRYIRCGTCGKDGHDSFVNLVEHYAKEHRLSIATPEQLLKEGIVPIPDMLEPTIHGYTRLLGFLSELKEKRAQLKDSEAVCLKLQQDNKQLTESRERLEVQVLNAQNALAAKG